MSEEEGEAETPSGPVENAWAIKVPEFKKGDMKSHLLDESSFSVLFPKYREKYLKECWPLLKKTLDEYGVIPELDLIEGRMTVRTTRKTWDPYVIIKARDIIVLLGRSVPVEHAIKILKDDITYELIKIRNLVRNKDRFVKRRQRLVGGNGTTLKALELLTNCYVLVQGATVSAIGPHKGVLQVVRVVKETMNNIHPVYLLKALMIKRQLMQDSNLKNEDWSRFIPKFVPKNVQRKKPHKVRKTKKEYTPFPPAPTERKVDKEMAEGKFFIDQEEKKRTKKRKITDEMKVEVANRQKEKRAKAFVAPEEPKYKPPTSVNTKVDVEALKRKVKKKKV